MRVGMTGTHKGATTPALKAFRNLLNDLHATELHHGDCIGADTQAHIVAKNMGLRVVVHPPSNPKKRAWCPGDEVRSPSPYLVRNKAIVTATSVLVALPGLFMEEHRSGTWSAVRAARRANRPRFIIWPDGTVEKEQT